jgi:hypothetical protein
VGQVAAQSCRVGHRASVSAHKHVIEEIVNDLVDNLVEHMEDVRTISRCPRSALAHPWEGEGSLPDCP